MLKIVIKSIFCKMYMDNVIGHGNDYDCGDDKNDYTYRN